MAPAFPHDLFHFYILPDLLSDYVHRLLVDGEPPPWNPFYTLPLVSRPFHQSCCTLCRAIFGPDTDKLGPQSILSESLHYWSDANRPPRRALPVDWLPDADLKCADSLIQVYVCTAIAKSCLNLDVLWHLDLERSWEAGELDDAVRDEEEVVVDMDVDGDLPYEDWRDPMARRFKMRDKDMHRLFRPLTCAIELCDRIRPARLAYIVANYLAEVIPRYATVPLILKCTQDLEGYASSMVSRKRTLVFLEQTLRLLTTAGPLVRQIQDIGKLVRSFSRSRGSVIPSQVLRETKVLQALDKVAADDWGEDTPEIHQDAMSVKMRLQSAEG